MADPIEIVAAMDHKQILSRNQKSPEQRSDAVGVERTRSKGGMRR
jgi:hypothetical protein